jgi:hypothetical protein
VLSVDVSFAISLGFSRNFIPPIIPLSWSRLRAVFEPLRGGIALIYLAGQVACSTSKHERYLQRIGTCTRNFERKSLK